MFSVSAVQESHVSYPVYATNDILDHDPCTHYRKHSETLSSQPVVGVQSLIVISVMFPDKPSTKTFDQITTMVFTKMNEYYLEVSYGKMWFVGSVLQKCYVLSQPMSYYGAENASINDIKWQELIDDGIRRADSDVDYRLYRYVMIVDSGNNWNHGIGYGPRKIETRDGTVEAASCVISESAPLGVFAHETGHMLGLPDLYDYDYKTTFVGDWDLMGTGDINGPYITYPYRPADTGGSVPAHISAWGKIRLGWIAQSQVLTVKSGSSSSVTVENLEARSSSIKAVILSVTTYQYFLVEARKRVGFDYWEDWGDDSIKLLVYYVDETIPSGHGPVRLQDALSPPKIGSTPTSIQKDPYKFTINILSASSDSFSLRVDYYGYGLTIRTGIPNISIKLDEETFSTNAAGNIDLRASYSSHLIAIPETVPKGINSRYSFTSWSDGKTSSARLITVQTDMSINANYKTQHHLTVNSQYGTVQGDGWYDEGQSATVAAGDTSGYRFLGWTLDGSTRLGTSITVQMYAPHTLKANYGLPSTFEGSVEIASTSTLSRYSYDQKNRLVSFVVSGDPGTLGFSAVRIPKQLLWPEQPTVKIDGQVPLLASISDGGSVWIVSFSYTHSDHLVAIPEFHQLGLTLALALCVAMILSRRAIRRD